MSGKGKEVLSFEYDKEFLSEKERFILDPQLGWYSGTQFSNQSQNFGVFLDSMPDTWGQTLMKRRAVLIAKKEGDNLKVLHNVDYLLGVYDESRMGALRYKLHPDGAFLDNNQDFPTPHWSSIRKLQHGAKIVESGSDSSEMAKWLSIIMAPGSSLGGARPKANILDNNNHLWIAKFPSKNDIIDKGAWEYLAYNLATQVSIKMTESKIEKVAGNYHTFFTKRFDRFKKNL